MESKHFVIGPIAIIIAKFNESNDMKKN